MNITPQVPNLSIPTVLNPHTESLRRENNQREVITPPTPTSQSAAEKGAASEKERSRTPAQKNAHIDFASIREKSELANVSITEKQERHNQNHNEHSAEPDDSSRETIDNKDANDNDDQAEILAKNKVINELKQRDQEVRTHEIAHASVGGKVTGAPSYTYEQGPDGKKYAVEGEVSVDLTPVYGDPQATMTKMQQAYSAALAPVNPSVQDIKVANTAAQLILKAQSGLLSELTDNTDEKKQDLSILDSSSSARQSKAIMQRSLRIESYYATITEAYEKAPTFNFQLTA